MLKFICSVFIILLSTKIIAEEHYWVFINKTADGTTEFFIDSNNIVQVENYTYFWSKSNYLDESENSGTPLSTLTLNATECNKLNSIMITYTGYGRLDLKGSVIINAIIPDIDPSIFEWSDFNEDNSFYDTLLYACKNN